MLPCPDLNFHFSCLSILPITVPIFNGGFSPHILLGLAWPILLSSWAALDFVERRRWQEDHQEWEEMDDWLQR